MTKHLLQAHRGRRGVRHGAAATIAATICALTFASALSVPASAAAPWPHTAQQRPDSTQSVQPHDSVAPLTQANFVVTDLATNDATVYQWSTVTPITNQNSFCNISTTSDLCANFGDGPGPNGGSIGLSPHSGGWQAGSVYDSIGGPSQINVAGQNCGEVGTVSSALEVDQYTFMSGATPGVTTLALQIDCTTTTTDISGTIAYNIVPTDPSDGYYLFGQQGEITGFGNDNYLSYLDGAQYYDLNSPIVGMAPTPDGAGYWMVGSDGGVFASGDAGFYGSTGSLHLNKPVVGMAATPDGKGYWFVASDGGIFAYGDAQFYGSRGGQPLNKPIVGMASTPDGKGYWLVASDGGIFSYGDAGFYGSTGSLHLNKPVVGMTPTPDGNGYWFVASDGGIFAYGDAHFYGSTGSMSLNEPIVGMTPTPDGNGYWFVASDGGIFSYGDAGFFGSLGGSGVTDVAGMSLGQ